MGRMADESSPRPWPSGVGRDSVRRASLRAPEPAPAGSALSARTTWEYRQLSLPRGTGRETARAVLVEAAEVERWELARLRLHPDGRRTVWLRRRILRVPRTA
jgi:hypothetical protein